MSAFIAKITFVLAYILSALTGFDYIGIPTHDLLFDYKNGQSPSIVHYLALKNVGPQKARFDFSSDMVWIKVAWEGHDINRFPEIEVQRSVNLLIEIDPRRLEDGLHQGKVKIMAAKVSGSDIYDSEEINVVLKKNYTPTPTPEATLEASRSSPKSTTSASKGRSFWEYIFDLFR